MEYRSHNIYFATHKSRSVKMLLHSMALLSHRLAPTHQTVANRRKLFQIYLPPGARPRDVFRAHPATCDILSAMKTKTLELAMDKAAALPAEVQEQIGRD